MPEAVSVTDLWWRYPTFSEKPNPWTLRGIRLRVEQGTCFGITGPSGAGKTTLCRILMGILPYTTRLTPRQLPGHFQGSVSVLGQAVTEQTARTHQIGMVQQDPENQFLRMSLLHELALGLQAQNIPTEEIEQRAYEALCWVGLEHLWEGAAYLHPANLSGGQKQRIAIAAFLAMRPQVLILDEPTSDLDPVGKREVIKTIARLRRDYQVTILLVEQDPDILATFCDEIALLNQGRVELVAPPGSFYAKRDLLEQSGATAGELPRISWATGYTYEARPPLTVSEGEQAFAQAAQSILSRQAPPRVPFVPTRQECVIQAEQVCYHYEDGTVALKGVSATLSRGEMLALLGPNGSGKTTFAKILAGMYRPTRGTVHILGQDLRSKRVRLQLPRHVGYVFQNPDHQLFCRKVSEEIEYGLKNLGIDPAVRQRVIAETLESVNLSPVASEDPLFLSKGQRQRVAVASVLAMGPDILIVDEPTTGQDYRAITEIMSLLTRLQQQCDFTLN